MVFGDISVFVVGCSILGDVNYVLFMLSLKFGEYVIFIVLNGMESFKGFGFVCGGIFDCIQVVQDIDIFIFWDFDYQNFYGICVIGVFEYCEFGIFIICSLGFLLVYLWKLVFLVNKLDVEIGVKMFISFDQEYWFLVDELVGGWLQYDCFVLFWLQIWKVCVVEIGLFVFLLIGVGVVYVLCDMLVCCFRCKDKCWVFWFKYVLWIMSIGFVGFYFMVQLFIMQVLIWFYVIFFKWWWDLFLFDLFIFLFWWFIIISVFFWGCGMFCGWLCFYGLLSEIFYKVGGKFGFVCFQFQLFKVLYDKFKWIKYGVFVGLFGMLFYLMGIVEKLVEIELFKIMFLVGVWNWMWFFVMFWSVLVVVVLFIEWLFCKYLCLLGVLFVILLMFWWWGLKCKQECGLCCVCEVGCGL